MVSPIAELLTQFGLKTESPAFLKGKSGAKHGFDIIAYKSNAQNAIVIDVAISTEGVVSEQPVIALFAKIFDVSPEKAFLVAVPKLNDNARKIAELYNIQAVEAKSQADVVKALSKRLSA